MTNQDEPQDREFKPWHRLLFCSTGGEPGPKLGLINGDQGSPWFSGGIINASLPRICALATYVSFSGLRLLQETGTERRTVTRFRVPRRAKICRSSLDWRDGMSESQSGGVNNTQKHPENGPNVKCVWPGARAFSHETRDDSGRLGDDLHLPRYLSGVIHTCKVRCKINRGPLAPEPRRPLPT